MEAIYELIERVLPSYSSNFEIELAEDSVEYYEIDSKDGKILLRGSTLNSICMAFGYYVKHILNLNFSWCGENSEFDKLTLPVYTKKVVEQKYRAYMNYCTHSYSCAFWDWERWEKEIDIMAMNGINLPLAVTGTEGVWYETLLEMGFTDEEARSFIVGPAFLAWQYMTNIESFSGPIPKSWIDKHIELGKKIIERELSLGMHPVQQGFSGYVPILLKDKYPEADINIKDSWNNIGKTAELNPKDELFGKMGRIFLKNQKKLFGAHGFYAQDPFHESKPPVEGDDYLKDVAKTISSMLEEFDENYIWIMQGWSVIKGIVTAIPKEKLLILSLANEAHTWFEGYWGYNFVAGTLHNFGGRMNLRGDMKLLASNKFKAIQKDYPNAIGTGLFMEGIGQNPIYYDLAFDMLTETEAIDLDKWIEGYVLRRYKTDDKEIIEALGRVVDAIYADGTDDWLMSSEIICTRPCLEATATVPIGRFDELGYDNKLLADVVRLFDSKDIKTGGFFYDKADLTRQMMSNYAYKLYKECMSAFKNKDIDTFKAKSKLFIELLNDFDALLDSVKAWRLQTWIDNACSFADTDEEKALYEYNARLQVTIWGNEEYSWLFDYAWKEWSGLVADYYAARWQKYFDMLNENPDYSEDGLKVFQNRIDWDADKFREDLAKWEAEWVKSRKPVKHGTYYDGLIGKILNKYDI